MAIIFVFCFINGMDNSVNLNKVPSPNFVDGTQSPKRTVVQKRKLNMPRVGVLDTPKISSSPLRDTLIKNKQENPKTAYKTIFPEEKTKGVKFDFILTSTVLVCSLFALLSSIKELAKHK